MNREKEIARVTLAGSVVNLLLVCLKFVAGVDGVSDPHKLRTRQIGNRIAAEVHIRLDGRLTLTEAHEKATEVERRFHEHFGPESHIIIHMEPEK